MVGDASGVRWNGLRGSWWRDVVQNAVTALTLNDAVIAPDLLKDLRAQAHVADRAQAISGGTHSDSSSRSHHLFEHRQIMWINLPHEALALGQRVLQGLLGGHQLLCQLPFLGLDVLLLGCQARFSFLHVHDQTVGLNHSFEHFVFHGAQLTLGDLDLLLDRLILAIGFHLEELILEFREAALKDGGILLERPANLLVLLQPVLDVIDETLCFAQPIIRGLKALRMRVDASPGICDCRFVLLKLDKPFEIWRHLKIDAPNTQTPDRSSAIGSLAYWELDFFEWARQDSNLGPTDYEPAALTAELRALN
jgi:hypothetical protein